MRISNLVVALSVAASAYLSWELYHEKSITAKVKDAVRAEWPKVAADGFINGCMMAVAQLAHKTPDEADYDMYLQWCVKNGNVFAESKKKR